MYNQHLRDVFNQIDQDGSGFINGDEMEYFLADPSLNTYLESIDIFPNDARALFRLLDDNDSGEVSIDEFCEGCLRLKGQAKSFDIHLLMYNNERVYEKLSHIIRYVHNDPTHSSDSHGHHHHHHHDHHGHHHHGHHHHDHHHHHHIMSKSVCAPSIEHHEHSDRSVPPSRSAKPSTNCPPRQTNCQPTVDSRPRSALHFGERPAGGRNKISAIAT